MSDKKWSTADKDTQLIFEGWNNFLNEEEEENLDEGLFDRLKAAGKAFMSSGDEEASDVKDKTAEPEKAGPTDEEIEKLHQAVRTRGDQRADYAQKYIVALLWKAVETRKKGFAVRAVILSLAMPEKVSKFLSGYISKSPMSHKRMLSDAMNLIFKAPGSKIPNHIAKTTFKDFLSEKNDHSEAQRKAEGDMYMKYYGNPRGGARL
jgi:hypothetical protein